MASNKKASKSTEPTTEDEIVDGQGKAETVDAEGSEPDETTDDANAELNEPTTEDVNGMMVTAPAAITTDLHGLLSKEVRSINTHAGQEKVFAIHQLEMMTGRLKMIIPAGIAATDDPAIIAGLNALMSIL